MKGRDEGSWEAEKLGGLEAGRLRDRKVGKRASGESGKLKREGSAGMIKNWNAGMLEWGRAMRKRKNWNRETLEHKDFETRGSSNITGTMDSGLWLHTVLPSSHYPIIPIFR
ncbi:MAG: hypothetical protein WCD88_15150, partial [Desulfobacterales bacterium]